MINKKLLVIGLISSVAMVGCNKETAKQDDVVKLDTLEQKVNYIVAQNMALNLQQSGLTIEPGAFAQGLRDIHNGVESRLTDEEKEVVMQTFQEQAMAKHEEELRKLSDSNLAEGQAYLETNQAKEGVQVTDSGLQYRVLTEGDGVKPSETDTVSVHYSGKLIDGTEFDSSYGRGEPVNFPVNGVIAGWTEALQLMPQGSKWELVIPSDLAYGPGGNGPIPPNAVLVFEVELLEVKASD
jgi:FKBP-type peptidyl-prolyl cis-trans isomerase FkpA